MLLLGGGGFRAGPPNRLCEAGQREANQAPNLGDLHGVAQLWRGSLESQRLCCELSLPEVQPKS